MEKWLQRFQNFLIAIDIKDDTRKRAMLLHYAGEGGQDVFDTLLDTGEPKDVEIVVNNLSEYFTPKVNVAYETYKFSQVQQRAGETLDCYHTRLRQLAANCSFVDIDREMMNNTMMIQTCTSSKLRRIALQKSDMTLTELLSTGRAMELAELQV